MRWLVILLLLATPVQARAQELYVLGGAIEHRERHDYSYSWQLEYLQGAGEHFAATLSYLNEGHLPEHHRDGNSVQLWARSTLFDRRLSLAAGAGPYYFFDTAKLSNDGLYSNDHGWGGLFSVAATWYMESRWLLHARVNWVAVDRHFDTLSAVAGLGYQLDAPPAPGPIPEEPPQEGKTTTNEITVFLGRTIVNSLGSEHSGAASIEYRRGLWRYLDWTMAWLYEGDNRLIRRNGLTTQLWAVREFLDDRLALGVGGGAYLVLDRRTSQQQDIDEVLSGILTLTGSYRFHPHWDVRTSWNRIVTNYNRDTDVILGGIGYRF